MSYRANVQWSLKRKWEKNPWNLFYILKIYIVFCSLIDIEHIYRIDIHWSDVSLQKKDQTFIVNSSLELYVLL